MHRRPKSLGWIALFVCCADRGKDLGIGVRGLSRRLRVEVDRPLRAGQLAPGGPWAPVLNELEGYCEIFRVISISL